MKTKQEWLDDCQAAFNKYIRLRDQHLPCISCGRFHNGQWHAGHFLSRGSNPELRFNEDNCHRQCAPCNNHLSGNQQKYREALVIRIGEERVASLEGPHEPLNLDIQQIKELREHYLGKIREIESYFPSNEDF